MLLLTFKYISRLLKCVAAVFMIITIICIIASLPSRENETEDTVLETTAVSNYQHVKFILLWTDPKATPFSYFGKGSSIFKAKSCEHTNCFITSDRHELGDSSLFDAILFNGPQLPQMLKMEDFPKSRFGRQKYVYANIESAQNYPLCTERFNSFFNWTWTYRLDSDSNWGYFVVKNNTKHIVAPGVHVDWKEVDSMEDIDEKLKNKLKTKDKSVAWFASNCNTKSRREDFVAKLREHLKMYGLDVHIFGACGQLQCPTYLNDRCLKMLKNEYYFYLAFENSFSEDYVTEKVLNAFKHNTVPIVYGGANYSRFLPPGSYLNANELGPEQLASTINQLTKTPKEYHKYFRWQNHYSFHYRYESPDTDDYCNFCKSLNTYDLVETRTVYRDIGEWWNGNRSCDNQGP